MDRISGFVVFSLGIGILWQGRHLSVGSLRVPGPGFFPTILAVVLIILSLFLIIPIGNKEKKKQPFIVNFYIRVLTVFVALLAYFSLLEYLGFVFMSFILMSFLFVSIGSYRWYIGLLSAFISIGLAYLLFEVLLMSNLPKGVFGF